MLRAMLFGTLGLVLAGAGMGCGHSAGPTAPKAAEAVVDHSAPCPELTQVKYPFLTCERDEWGGVVLFHEPQVLISARMPMLGSYVESEDYWGH